MHGPINIEFINKL